MRTTDLFTFNRSAKRLNESLAKTFGRKLNLETFSIEQLEDARNKLRTQIYTARSSSNFNETVENDALSKAQFMHDAIVAELAERDEPIVDNTVQEEAQAFYVMLLGPRSGQSDPYQGPFNSPDEAQAWIDTESPNPEDYEVGEYPAGQFGQYDNGQEVGEGVAEGAMSEIAAELSQVADDEDYDTLYKMLSDDGPVGQYLQDKIDEITGETGLHPKDDFEKIESMLMDIVQQEFGGQDDEGGDTDDGYALASAGHGSDEDYGTFNQGENVQTELSTNTLKSYQDKAGKDIVNTMTSGDHMTTDKSAKKVMNRMRGSEKADNKIWKRNDESAPPTAKGERMVKHIKKGYADDGKLTDKEKSIAYATAWKAHNKNESIEQTGEDMRNLREGEIQQASAIVTAKTMVDRVGRWIEELSGMENDTLLQLGDSIRDEMGQEQAKAFIQAVAPAIQQALDTLKGTRDTLSTGVRSLASGEQPAEMLGGEPGADMAAPAEPDAMNPAADDMAAEPAADDFAAAEPAAGGLGDAGREQRESIDRQSRLLKVLAG